MSEKTFVCLETVDNGKMRLKEGGEKRKQAEGESIKRLKKGSVFSHLFRPFFFFFCNINLKLGIDDS